ncbi:RibD family protein [Paenibacillus sp. DMB5]|uniref:RibD family protein n=1 Tax=Paenibacillus sp. DMB5 TaxID=1780103 RepID=UPI00076DC617|nr:RibD family protein [Paenibacillus sp. DMB5]KUP25930.1 hypothetical protein AWJ19_33480 [Paenibacillus sp. DMB5]
MKRPYVICHMLTSLDGKINGDYLKMKRAIYFAEEYEKIHESYGCNAWMCGRITMEEHFTLGHQLDLQYEGIPPIPRTDYIGNEDAQSYAIAVDPSGKLGWKENFIASWNEYRKEDHIIEILTEQVPDSYLTYLKDLGISYIFGGKENLDFIVVVEKLKNLFSIDKLMLEGGGYLNGAFLNEGLVDELSLIVAPIAEASSNSVTLFETSSFITNQHPVNFNLKEVEKLDDGGLLLKYVTRHD